MQLQERLLRQVLGLGNIAHHAQAERVNPAFMQRIKLGKCLVIAGLRARQNLAVARVPLT
jgi:hypothetical protein